MTEENVSNNENVAEIKKVNKPKRNFRGKKSNRKFWNSKEDKNKKKYK